MLWMCESYAEVKVEVGGGWVKSLDAPDNAIEFHAASREYSIID